jgi:hypothetical protein
MVQGVGVIWGITSQLQMGGRNFVAIFYLILTFDFISSLRSPRALR